MRLGWDDRSLNAPELARRAEAAGVQLITVHGRTRCQFYKGAPIGARCAPSKRAVSIPVVVNGDIASFDDADTALAASGADAVMVGRGAQGRPWLPGQIARYSRPASAKPRRRSASSSTLIRALYDEMLVHHGTAYRAAPRAQASRLGARCRGGDRRCARQHCSRQQRALRADRRRSGVVQRRSRRGLRRIRRRERRMRQAA